MNASLHQLINSRKNVDSGFPEHSRYCRMDFNTLTPFQVFEEQGLTYTENELSLIAVQSLSFPSNLPVFREAVKRGAVLKNPFYDRILPSDFQQSYGAACFTRTEQIMAYLEMGGSLTAVFSNKVKAKDGDHEYYDLGVDRESLNLPGFLSLLSLFDFPKSVLVDAFERDFIQAGKMEAIVTQQFYTYIFPKLFCSDPQHSVSAEDLQRIRHLHPFPVGAIDHLFKCAMTQHDPSQPYRLNRPYMASLLEVFEEDYRERSQEVSKKTTLAAHFLENEVVNKLSFTQDHEKILLSVFHFIIHQEDRKHFTIEETFQLLTELFTHYSRGIINYHVFWHNFKDEPRNQNAYLSPLFILAYTLSVHSPWHHPEKNELVHEILKSERSESSTLLESIPELALDIFVSHSFSDINKTRLMFSNNCHPEWIARWVEFFNAGLSSSIIQRQKRRPYSPTQNPIDEEEVKKIEPIIDEHFLRLKEPSSPSKNHSYTPTLDESNWEGANALDYAERKYQFFEFARHHPRIDEALTLISKNQKESVFSRLLHHETLKTTIIPAGLSPESFSPPRF